MHALGYYKCLKARGEWTVSIDPIYKPEGPELAQLLNNLEIDAEQFQADLDRGTKSGAPSFILWHSNQLGKYKGDGKNIGCTAFETSRLRPAEVAGLREMDTVCTYSSWGATALQAHGFEDPQVIWGPCHPMYLEQREMQEVCYEFDQFMIDGRDTAVVLSPGKWEKRKGHPMLVEHMTHIARATSEAESKDGRFALFGLWNNPFLNGLSAPMEALRHHGWEVKGRYQWRGADVIRYEFRDCSVFIFTEVPNYKDMLKLYRRADMMVSYSAGEGWDLPAVDSLFHDMQVVLSDNTAHQVYKHLADGTIMCHGALAHDGKWFHGEVGDWWPVNPSEAIQMTSAALGIANRRQSGSPLHQFSNEERKRQLAEICDPKILSIQIGKAVDL